MRIGIIGLGAAGSRHAQYFREYGQVGRYDLDPEKADYKTQDDLMDWADAIVIATPPSSHTSILRECVRRNLPALVEKPLATDSHGLQVILAHAETIHVPILVGYVWRYSPSLESFKASVLRMDGRYYMRGIYSQALKHRKVPPWLLDPREGGCLLEMSHLIDIAVYLFGPFKVYAADVRDNFVCLSGRWNTGETVELEMDYFYPGTIGQLTIMGTKSVQEWNRNQETDMGRLYGLQAAHFIDCVEHRQIVPRCSGTQGLATLQIAEEAVRASANLRHR